MTAKLYVLKGGKGEPPKRPPTDGARITRMLEHYLEGQVEAGANPAVVKRALLDAQRGFILKYPDK